MRLVGATRWFIRWPFMIEGVVVGFAGGLVAILILWLGKITVVDPLSDSFGVPRGAEQQHAVLPGAGRRSSSPPRCSSRRSAPASPCAASSRSEAAGVSARGAVAYAVALLAVLCRRALAGRPPDAMLPDLVRDAFVGRPAGLTAEAAEAIEDNYYRPVGRDRARQRLAAGHGARAAQAPRRPLLRILLAGKPGELQRADRRALLRGRALVVEVEAGPAGGRRSSSGSPADRAGIELGDTIVSVDGRVDRRARAAPRRPRRSRARKGPR